MPIRRGKQYDKSVMIAVLLTFQNQHNKHFPKITLFQPISSGFFVMLPIEFF